MRGGGGGGGGGGGQAAMTTGLGDGACMADAPAALGMPHRFTEIRRKKEDEEEGGGGGKKGKRHQRKERRREKNKEQGWQVSTRGARDESMLCRQQRARLLRVLAHARPA